MDGFTWILFVLMVTGAIFWTVFIAYLLGIIDIKISKNKLETKGKIK